MKKPISVRNAIQQFCKHVLSSEIKSSRSSKNYFREKCNSAILCASRFVSIDALERNTNQHFFFFVFCVYKKVRFYKSRSQCPTITIIIMNMTKIEANHTRSFLKQKSMTSFELRLFLVFSIINQLENW